MRTIQTVLLLAFLGSVTAALAAQTNLALTATPTTSGGGGGVYGPQHLNDTIINQNFSSPTTRRPATL